MTASGPRFGADLTFRVPDGARPGLADVYLDVQELARFTVG